MRCACYGCTGALDLSVSDVLAICSHVALTHIEVWGLLHWQDAEEEVDLCFRQCEEDSESVWTVRHGVPCNGCTSSSVAARLTFMRHVKERCIEQEQSSGFEQSDSAAQMGKLINELEQCETTEVAEALV